jgi:MFS family permease
MLAIPMARDLAISTPTVFAAFSAALVISALVGPAAGRAIDRRGGRTVLMATNGLFAAGLAALGHTDNVWELFAAWSVIGVAMGSGLYEAAFATLVRLYRDESRNAITGVTLIAGFASTIAWPLTTLLETHFGWRDACFVWAVLHLAIALPLNALVPPLDLEVPTRSEAASTPSQLDATSTTGDGRFAAVLLAYVFAVTWFISTAMASHLPRLLEAAGATLPVAVGIGALVGPAQVGGRLLEFGVLRHISPLLSARCAALGHPLGAALLVILGAPSAAAFAILHGAGNGILTIAKGTLPLMMFGSKGYGARQGWLMMPARVAQALAPFVFGMALDRFGASAAWLSSILGFSAFAALMVLSPLSPYRAPAAAS